MDHVSLIKNLLKLEDYSKHRSYSQDKYEQYLFGEIWSCLAIDEEDSDEIKPDDSEHFDAARQIMDEIDKFKTDHFEDIDVAEKITDEDAQAETVDEPDDFFLGGYKRPFFWSVCYTTCTFSDMIDEVFTLRCPHSIDAKIFGPLFDNLASLLNTGQMAQDLPELILSFKFTGLDVDFFNDGPTKKYFDSFLINNFDVKFKERLFVDGTSVRMRLMKFLMDSILGEKDRRFFERIGHCAVFDISVSDTAVCYDNYIHGKYPFYPIRITNDSEIELEDVIREFVLLFYVQGFSCDADYETINTLVREALSAFYACGYEKQIDESYRLTIARSLNEIVNVDSEHDNVLADLLGVYLPEHKVFLNSVGNVTNWVSEHILHEGDVILPISDWKNGIYFFTDFKQLAASFDMKRFKVLNDRGYYDYKVKSFYINMNCPFENFVEANQDFLKDAEGIVLPVPFWFAKKKKAYLNEWLRVCFAIMGYNVSTSKARLIINRHEELTSHFIRNDKRFCHNMKEVIDQVLNNSTCFDSTLSGAPSVPMEIVEGIVKVLD